MAVGAINSANYLRRNTNLPTQSANLTIACWVRFDSLGADRYAVSLSGSSGAQRMQIFFYNSNGQINYHYDNSQRLPLGTINVSEWRFVCIRRDGSNGIAGWLSPSGGGVLTKSTDTPTSPTWTPDDFYLLRSTAGTSGVCTLAHLKFWDRTLTDAEVEQEQWALFPKTTTNLVIYSPLWRNGDATLNLGDSTQWTKGGTLTDYDGPPVGWGEDVRVDVPAAASGAISGTADMAITASGTIQATGALAGSAAIAVTGSAAIGGTGALAGSASAAITGSATLTGTGALVGSGAAAITASGVLAGTGALAGSAAAAITGSATLTGTGALAGSSTATITGSAALTGTGALVGSASASITTSGTLINGAAGAATGTAALAVTATGTLSATGALAGSGSAAVTASGVLSGTAAAAGSATTTVTATGALTGTGALAGAAAASVTATGTLTNATTTSPIVGAAAVSVSASGVLTGVGALAGVATLVVTLTDTGVLPPDPLLSRSSVTISSTAGPTLAAPAEWDDGPHLLTPLT